MASNGEKEVLVPSESSIKGIVEAQRILDTIKTSYDSSQNDKNLKSVLSFLKSKNAKINWDGGNIGISVSSGDEGDYNNIKTTLNVLLQMEKIKINPDNSEIALIQPPNPTQTASVELTTTLTSVELTKLKADIEAGKLTKELFLEVIRALGDKEKVKPEQKPFILSLLFSELNKKGINVGFTGDKTNKDWKISLSTKKIEISEDTSNFESILNEYLGTSFTRQDVLKSLLFKTETVDEYLKDAPDKKDIRKYAVFLCEKYNVAGGLKYENTGIKTSHMPEYEKSSLYNMRFENEAVFNAFIVEIKTKVLNVADRDFLIAYYNDLYYNEGKNNSGALEKYSSDIGKVSVQMVQGFATLSDSQKRELLGTENLSEKIDRAQKDPIGFVKETINNGGIASLLWGFLLGGIIGSISGIGFFKGGLGGALLGFGFSAFGMDGITEMAQKASMGVKEWLSKLPKDTSGLRDKYLHILTNNNIPGNLDKEKLTKTYALLLNNEKFRSSKATNLDVFLDSGSNYKKAFDYFKSIGIDLKNEDIPYYEYVFSELKKQREADGVGSYTSDESMEAYLKRTAKVETDSASTASTSVAAGTASGTASGSAVAPGSASVSAPGDSRNPEADLSAGNVKATLDYFGLTENDRKLFESSELNLFLFLVNIKSFIENDLKGLDSGITEKLKQSVKIKAGIVKNRITELQNKEIKEKGSLNDFSHNRRTINTFMSETFGKVYNNYLPSAYMLLKSTTEQNNRGFAKDKYAKLQEMFASDLTKDGDFDKKFWSSTGKFEIWDSTKNNWEVFDASNEEDLKHMFKFGFDRSKMGELSMLSAEDQHVQDKAELGYMALLSLVLANDAASFTGVWTVPGLAIGTGYSASEIATDDYISTEILKGLGIIPSEYNDNEGLGEKAMLALGLIPFLGAGIRFASKSAMVTAFMAKLAQNPGRLQKFNDIKNVIAGKLKFRKKPAGAPNAPAAGAPNAVSALKNFSKEFDTFNKNFLVKAGEWGKRESFWLKRVIAEFGRPIKQTAELIDIFKTSDKKMQEVIKLIVLGERNKSYTEFKSYYRSMLTAAGVSFKVMADDTDDLGIDEIFDYLVTMYTGVAWQVVNAVKGGS